MRIGYGSHHLITVELSETAMSGDLQHELRVPHGSLSQLIREQRFPHGKSEAGQVALPSQCPGRGELLRSG